MTIPPVASALNEHQQRALHTGFPLMADALTTAVAILGLASRASQGDRPVVLTLTARTRGAVRALHKAHAALGLGALQRDQRFVLLEQVQRLQVALDDEAETPPIDGAAPDVRRELAELRLLTARLEMAVLNLRPGTVGGIMPRTAPRVAPGCRAHE